MNDLLVVEDEPGVRALVGALLKTEGIPYRTAVHGGEALARVREAQPAVVLLDIHMPEVTGPAYCDRLHTEGSRDDRAIVVMTARAQAAEYERQCAAMRCCPSPFDLDQLLAVVTRFLDQGRRDHAAPGDRGLPPADRAPSPPAYASGTGLRNR